MTATYKEQLEQVIQNAKEAINAESTGSDSAEPTSENEVIEVTQEAVKVLQEKSEQNHLKEALGISEFKPSRKTSEILSESLNKIFGSKDDANHILKSLEPFCVNADKLMSTTEAREAICDAISDSLQSDLDYKQKKLEIDAEVKKSLLSRRYGTEGGARLEQEYFEKMEKMLGKTVASKILANTTPSEYVNSIIESNNKDMEDYRNWKNSSGSNQNIKSPEYMGNSINDIKKNIEMNKNINIWNDLLKNKM